MALILCNAQEEKEDENMVEDDVALLKRLDGLRVRHQELDDMIDQLDTSPTANEFELRRLKKEKLAVRDQIARIEDVLYPDIIA